MTDGNTIRSVAKAMELLQLLSDAGDAMTLTAISERAGLPKSTVFGILPPMPDYAVIPQHAAAQAQIFIAKNEREKGAIKSRQPANGTRTALWIMLFRTKKGDVPPVMPMIRVVTVLPVHRNRTGYPVSLIKRLMHGIIYVVRAASSSYPAMTWEITYSSRMTASLAASSSWDNPRPPLKINTVFPISTEYNIIIPP